MGYCKPRHRKKGVRYTAIYIDADGNERSAGTFDLEDDADEAWRKAERMIKRGKGDLLIQGRTLLKDYIENDWLPNHQLEASTKQNRTYALRAHIIPHFGDEQMMDIHTLDIKRWLTKLKQDGVSAVHRRYLKMVLSSVLGTAVDDGYIESNPCLSAKTEHVPDKPLQIFTPEQFDRFYHAVEDDISKLLLEVGISTGMRWGELSELRVKDFDTATNVFTVARAVVMLTKAFHPDGKRFLVKDYPKEKKYRLVKIDPQVGARIAAHIQKHRLGGEDLLFWYVAAEQRHASTLEGVDITTLGLTEPNEAGNFYRHGTMNGYTSGNCRCRYCRAAMADYRRARRDQGKDQPRTPRVWDTDGHIPGRWFRESIIKPALKRAAIPVDIRMHLLRHAHASWLLNGGADLVVVKHRLGHGSIRTTERYLHTVENADETAIEALNRVRSRSPFAGKLESTTDPVPAVPETVSMDLLPQEKLLELIGSAQAALTQRLLKQANP